MANTTWPISTLPGPRFEIAAPTTKRHRGVYTPLVRANEFCCLRIKLLSIDFTSMKGQPCGLAPLLDLSKSFRCRLKLVALLLCLHFPSTQFCMRGINNSPRRERKVEVPETAISMSDSSRAISEV
ncbi:hypothetical protein SAMN05445850_4541 [Paraburkholderia tuberum]|uniref:Uncharacterized protein n=1 Tax=Paraburkholderia tuberum TaxID=157910 RepID=A0A1H1JBK6_9BURK|nr:hypothetical protein SAMN05445850_4541 [Paraburkholderia tuberum]